MNLRYVISWVGPDGTKYEATTNDDKFACELGNIICRMFGIQVRIDVIDGTDA